MEIRDRGETGSWVRIGDEGESRESRRDVVDVHGNTEVNVRGKVKDNIKAHMSPN